MKLEWPRLVLFAWFSVLCGSTAMAQDLVISSVSLGPLRLTGGTDEVIHLSTRNIGSAVSPASTSVIVLSRDATIGRDDLVIGVVPVRSLVPNDTDSTQQSFPIPNCMGDWSPCWIGAIADVGNVVAESNENNNTVQQRLAGCRFGPSARGQVHWRPQWGTPALATTTATFDTSVGGTARM